FYDIFGLFDAEVGEFADMTEPVLAWQHLHEATKFLNRDDLAPVDLSNLNVRGHAFDFFAGHAHALFVDGIDFDCAIVLDVDFAARAFNQGFDVLATGP